MQNNQAGYSPTDSQGMINYSNNPNVGYGQSMKFSPQIVSQDNLQLNQ